LLTPEESQGLVSRTWLWLRYNWKWMVGLFLAGLVISRFDLHFGYVDEEKKEAVRLIEQFHERMNAEQFEQIYDDADPAFRKSKQGRMAPAYATESETTWPIRDLKVFKT
jgi:hypothetical protein